MTTKVIDSNSPWAQGIAALIGAVLSWLISSVWKVSRSDFEKALTKIDSIEHQLADRITRNELREELQKLRNDSKEATAGVMSLLADLKSDIRALSRHS